jgi:hypothetical protein
VSFRQACAPALGASAGRVSLHADCGFIAGAAQVIQPHGHRRSRGNPAPVTRPCVPGWIVVAADLPARRHVEGMQWCTHFCECGTRPQLSVICASSLRRRPSEAFKPGLLYGRRPRLSSIRPGCWFTTCASRCVLGGSRHLPPARAGIHDVVQVRLFLHGLEKDPDVVARDNGFWSLVRIYD